MNIKDDFILSELRDGYLVGGAVRDFLLGKTSYDRDIAIKNAGKFARKLAEKFDATFITLDEEFEIYRALIRLDRSDTMRGTDRPLSLSSAVSCANAGAADIISPNKTAKTAFIFFPFN